MMAGQTTSVEPEGTAVQPFTISVPDEALADLRKRIAATRLPDKELVEDPSQGVQLATIQKVMEYWGTDYNWRNFEAKLNALPQFMMQIDGVDIHFIHVRSKHENAMPPSGRPLAGFERTHELHGRGTELRPMRGQSFRR